VSLDSLMDIVEIASSINFKSSSAPEILIDCRPQPLEQAQACVGHRYTARRAVQQAYPEKLLQQSQLSAVAVTPRRDAAA
jgi:hypothetical protein